jgi:hypothetical protein
VDCRRVALVDEATGRPVGGVEDLAVDEGRGAIYLSAYDRRWQANGGETRPSGGIYRLDLGEIPEDPAAGRPVAVANLTAGFAATAPFYPHGIDLLPATEGGAMLAAINRRGEARAGLAADTTIELFALDGAGLAHRRTIADPAFCRANDLLMLGPDRLLITVDQASCDAWLAWLERISAYPGGHVLLWQAGEAHRGAGGIAFANGIGRAGEQVAVAATRGHRLQIFALADLVGAAETGRQARPLRSVALPGGPDNLNRGSDGRLHAALLPDLFRHFLMQQGLADTAPSRIVRFDGALQAPPALVFEAEAPPLSGITAAVALGGRLIAGAAWDDGLMVCRLGDGPPAQSETGATAEPGAIEQP